MSRSLAVGAVVGVLAALLAMATPASAARHEQVVFSGEADGTFAGVATDVGFWIGVRSTRRATTTTAAEPSTSTR